MPAREPLAALKRRAAGLVRDRAVLLAQTAIDAVLAGLFPLMA